MVERERWSERERDRDGQREKETVREKKAREIDGATYWERKAGDIWRRSRDLRITGPWNHVTFELRDLRIT